MVESCKQTGDKKGLWASHMHGRKREYLQIEKLANLEKLPKPYGFLVTALPVKFEDCTAGWCRAAAIFKE
jgi:kynurenine formamidase